MKPDIRPTRPKRHKQITDWRLRLEAIRGAYSERTLTLYRGDFQAFQTWCRRNGRLPLPATPATVAEFLLSCARRYATATVLRRRCAIAFVHTICSLDNPGQSEEVLFACRAIVRSKGLYQKQALGLTRHLKERLIAACPPDIKGLRDRALISLGYDTLCRRSELVALKIEDIQKNDNGSGLILIRRSKSDTFGQGRLAFISAGTMHHIMNWLGATGLEQGPIFRPLYLGPQCEAALNSAYVTNLIRERARLAGVEEAKVARLTSHSMRVGAAQDMAEAGFELVAIMQAGGWKSMRVALHYTEACEMPWFTRVNASASPCPGPTNAPVGRPSPSKPTRI